MRRALFKGLGSVQIVPRLLGLDPSELTGALI